MRRSAGRSQLSSVTMATRSYAVAWRAAGPELLLCRVSVVFAELRPQQVQQAQFVAAGDLLPQNRSHDVLEIVVVDFPDRLETDGTWGCRTSA